jgi:hypothetical protein
MSQVEKKANCFAIGWFIFIQLAFFAVFGSFLYIGFTDNWPDMIIGIVCFYSLICLVYIYAWYKICRKQKILRTGYNTMHNAEFVIPEPSDTDDVIVEMVDA